MNLKPTPKLIAIMTALPLAMLIALALIIHSCTPTPDTQTPPAPHTDPAAIGQ